MSQLYYLSCGLNKKSLKTIRGGILKELRPYQDVATELSVLLITMENGIKSRTKSLKSKSTKI